MKHHQLIHDWNTQQAALKPGGKRVLLNDESLRDGLQSPSVKDPTIEQKIEILHLMESLGINMLDIGLPGAGPRAYGDVERLAREIASAKMKIKPNCAARTHKNDITPVAEISQKTGVAIECATFIGSSPIRRYTEDWSDDFLQKTTAEAVTYARSLGLDVMYVTEDTSRCDPETVKRLYTTAIECGARAIVVCDTCGHATPDGVRALITFVMTQVVEPSGEKIRVDWHGHCDRGLAIANSFAALEAGADCVHACAIGIGERVGNTQMDQMLVNLKLMGISPWAEQDLSKLKEYCEKVSQYTGVPIPKNYPVVGADAFRTATGVHASAVIKAIKKGDRALADEVYSGVPASEFGMQQTIEVGPMSGKSNIIHWLETRGVALEDTYIEKIYARAKKSDRLLTEAEIMECCQGAAKGAD
ncbi:MAG: 2-isopropylmalate synthase [Candidatus Koribacter versatilis]|uniref:2-isopropylmalate synthase n=1 Tax=Candidatus Korobacter versatilis TaxID=658062 RepID=A0A932A7V2_9BACT|nr:2-isopropylmalate synthase [Candidatus Koribacter versatilis]